jgi:hypothetical protein
MKHSNYHFKKFSLAGMVFILAVLLLLNPVSVFSETINEQKSLINTTQARLAVEQAWETYHHAALGGTLSSPVSQTELEMNLHKSRALLAEAYGAEDKGDMKTARKLINQILKITNKVIADSQEPKK